VLFCTLANLEQEDTQKNRNKVIMDNRIKVAKLRFSGKYVGIDLWYQKLAVNLNIKPPTWGFYIYDRMI
jgi:hypothetical protein